MKKTLICGILISLLVTECFCLNWKFWELIFPSNQIELTGLNKLKTLDRKRLDNVLKDTDEYLNYMETKVDKIIGLSKDLESEGKAIYEVIIQIFEFNEGIKVSSEDKTDQPTENDSSSPPAASIKGIQTNTNTALKSDQSQPQTKHSSATKSSDSSPSGSEDKSAQLPSSKSQTISHSKSTVTSSSASVKSYPTIVKKNIKHNPFSKKPSSDTHLMARSQPKRRSKMSYKHLIPVFNHHSIRKLIQYKKARHMLSDESKKMAEQWKSYFASTKDLNNEVAELLKLIQEIKGPGIELLEIFKRLPPRMEIRIK